VTTAYKDLYKVVTKYEWENKLSIFVNMVTGIPNFNGFYYPEFYLMAYIARIFLLYLCDDTKYKYRKDRLKNSVFLSPSLCTKRSILSGQGNLTQAVFKRMPS